MYIVKMKQTVPSLHIESATTLSNIYYICNFMTASLTSISLGTASSTPIARRVSLIAILQVPAGVFKFLLLS